MDIGVAFDDIAVDLFHGGSDDVQFVVQHHQRVLLLHHVVVQTDPVQVLLQETLQQQVVFLQGFFLLLDRQFVQQHLVVPLVELVQVAVLLVLLGGYL